MVGGSPHDLWLANGTMGNGHMETTPPLNRQTDRTDITFLQLRWLALIIHNSWLLVELTLRSPELQGSPPCSCAVVHALALWRHLTDAPLCTLRSYSSQTLWTSWSDALDFPGKEMKMQVIGSIHKGESMIEGEKDKRTRNQIKGSNIEKKFAFASARYEWVLIHKNFSQQMYLTTLYNRSALQKLRCV